MNYHASALNILEPFLLKIFYIELVFKRSFTYEISTFIVLLCLRIMQRNDL